MSSANSSPPSRRTSAWPVERRLRPVGDLAQQLVALGVAEGVVDVLEGVEVEDADARTAATAPPAAPRARAAAPPGWAARSAGRAATRAAAGRAARRCAGRPRPGWRPSAAPARRPASKPRWSPRRSSTASSPTGPLSPSSGTMMLSRRPWPSSQARCCGSRVLRRTSSVSPSPATACGAQPGRPAASPGRSAARRPSPVEADLDAVAVAERGADEGHPGALGVQDLPGLLQHPGQHVVHAGRVRHDLAEPVQPLEGEVPLAQPGVRAVPQQEDHRDDRDAAPPPRGRAPTPPRPSPRRPRRAAPGRRPRAASPGEHGGAHGSLDEPDDHADADGGEGGGRGGGEDPGTPPQLRGAAG